MLTLGCCFMGSTSRRCEAASGSERVEDDALGTDRLGLRLEDRQQSGEIEIARLDEVGIRLSIDEHQLVRGQLAYAPSEAFDVLLDWLAVSSNATKIPGSPSKVAPWTTNCSAKIVLPAPGPPTNNDVRPLGKPPRVISSKPRMPVGALGLTMGAVELRLAFMFR